ncbi:MAG: hypothetical protein HQL15_04335 [Candidatus Omnitrophica bacterium]|nr:hypothetical protein [Candidatus Omnitrophota bacterium]
MMPKLLITLLLFLLSVLCSGHVLAQEQTRSSWFGDMTIKPDQMKAYLQNLRNPYLSPIVDEPPKVIVPPVVVPEQIVLPKPSESKEPPKPVVKPTIESLHLKLTGVVWGGALPQAIINDQVFMVGDYIDLDAKKDSDSKSNSEDQVKVVSISQKGVQILYKQDKMLLTAEK